MKDEEKLDLVLERFYQRFNRYNTKVLETLGAVIKQFDGLTPKQAHKLAQELRYSIKIEKLLKELSQLSGKSVREVDTLLDKVAKENVDFAEVYYEVKGKKFIPYEENKSLQRYVETIKKETMGTFKQLSKSKQIGFSLRQPDGTMIYKPLKNLFNDLLDEAVYNVSSGVSDYQTAMRSTIKQLADSGVKIHEEKATYPSGYNRRIDSTVRQNVLTGVRMINIGIQERIGEELGANGVEISAHTPCALDHLEYQGRQFTKEKFEKINSNLSRPIGDRGYNCRHFIFSVILDINQPSYTKKQLKDMREHTLKEVEYDGKKYNMYEISQIMRKIETSIRKNKDLQITARASGNDELISNAQKNISVLMSKYNEISRISGLDTYKNRISVTGYHRLKSYDTK